MKKRRLLPIGILIAIVLIISGSMQAYHVSGEVGPISELEDKLEGISSKEKEILKTLFSITQELEAFEREMSLLNDEINIKQLQVKEIEGNITRMQLDYDTELALLEKVLVSYQKGGPATYLEILLKADNLADFLKSINLIKDISHNLDELLVSIEEGKKNLEEERYELEGYVADLEAKRLELTQLIEKQSKLKQEQENFLSGLLQDRELYQQQLDDLIVVWEDCKSLFGDIVIDFKRIVQEGYITTEDLNLSIGFFKMSGTIYEDTFNRILKEHSDLPETIFSFHENQVVIEVPDKHLILKGNFVLEGDSSIRFVPAEGTFYDLPLETTSIEELFEASPLMFDFKEMAGDSVSINFTVTSVQTREDCITFEIKPLFF